MTLAKLHKKFLIIITLFALVQLSYGQKTELNFNAYSGLFSFRGGGATSNSWITAYTPSIPGTYTINPYGKKSDFSYSFELQGQRISRSKNIYGLGVGFETLKSKVNIDTVNGGDFAYFKVAANGKTVLENTFITLNPFVGRQYFYQKMRFDLLAGIDIAFCLKSKEVGKATTNDKDYIMVENDKAKPSIDLRPRIQIQTRIKKFGFVAGYSLGLTNYQSQNKPKAYSSFLRVGLSYQLK
jgi:hypothetical protein